MIRHPHHVTHLITLHPEWAWAFHLGKDVENRTWRPPPSLTGRWLAIRAGAHVGGRPGRPSAVSGFENVAYMARRAHWSAVVSFGSREPILTAVWPGIQPKAPGPRPNDFLHTIRRSTLPRRCVTHVARLAISRNNSRSPWAVPGRWH